MRQLTKMVAENLSYHKARYRPSMMQEFEYLVAEGFYESIAEAIAEDLFFANELYRKTALKKIADPNAAATRKAS